jgi:hypothetical protein
MLTFVNISLISSSYYEVPEGAHEIHEAGNSMRSVGKFPHKCIYVDKQNQLGNNTSIAEIKRMFLSTQGLLGI